MSFQLNYGGDGLWLGMFSHFSADIVIHAISTRFGGGSQAPFDGLNLAMHNGDDPEQVIRNRAAFCRVLRLNSDDVVTAEQVHGDRIFRVNQNAAGQGAKAYDDAVATTDALITNCRNIPLMLFFADCVPVLIVDPIHRAIGVSHAGWKGTVSKIAQKTILSMKENFGTNPADCRVGIGPSIGACCYEVGDEVKEKFIQVFPKHADQIVKRFAEKWRLDLWRANRIQLEEIGISPVQIEVSDVCTSCNENVFFSYRADHGRTGRIAAVISLI